jgi:hypothetical protein
VTQEQLIVAMLLATSFLKNYNSATSIAINTDEMFYYVVSSFATMKHFLRRSFHLQEFYWALTKRIFYAGSMLFEVSDPSPAAEDDKFGKRIS